MRAIWRRLRLWTIAAMVGLSTVSAGAFEFADEAKYVDVPAPFTGEQWAPAVVEPNNIVWDHCGRVLFSYGSSLDTDANIVKCWEEVATMNNRSMSSLSRLDPGDVIVLPLTRQQVAAYEGRVIDRVDVAALDRQLAALRDEFSEFTTRLAAAEATANDAAAKAAAAEIEAAEAKAAAETAETAVAGLNRRADTFVDRGELDDFVREDANDPVLRRSDLADLGLSDLLTKEEAGRTYLIPGQVNRELLEQQAGIPSDDLLTINEGDRRYLAAGSVPVVSEPSFTLFGYTIPWWWLWVAIVALAFITILATIFLFRRSRTNRKDLRELKEKVDNENSGLHQRVKTVEKNVRDVAEKSDRALHFSVATADFAGYKLVGDTTKVPLTQSELERALAKDGDSIVYVLAPEDNLEDQRQVRFTRVDNAHGDGRHGLQVEGIAEQRHSIKFEISRVFTAFRNAGKKKQLVGINTTASDTAA